MIQHVTRGLLLVAAFASQGFAQPVQKDRAIRDTMHVYQPGIDVLDYDIVMMLPDTGKRITAVARLTVQKTLPVDSLRLDLIGLRVDSVEVGADRVPFVRDSTTIRIKLPAERRFGVNVYYDGAPGDGLIFSVDSLGRTMAFGDNWPNRARHWIPSVDHPSDKATVTWQVAKFRTHGHRVIANGRLREKSSIDGDTAWVWREDKPIPTYLMVVAAGPLVETDLGQTACGLSESDACVAQQVYTKPELKNYAPGPFAKAGAIVEFYSRLVGPYPYEKLAHLQSSTRFGGMENASAIFYSDNAFKRRAVRVGLIAHETAHQWFGNSVTEREWSHLWLSEGFATYFEQVWHEHDLGRDTLRANMARIRTQILGAKEVATRPVIDTAQTDLMALLNTNSYQKGGWVLHMLRTLVGDSAFFGGVRSYYARHRHSTALTDDLLRAMEASSGRKLGWFFDQWLRRPGFAEVKTHWEYDTTGWVGVTIHQTGTHGTYRFPLTVEIDDGRTVQRATIDVPAERMKSFKLPLKVAGPPRRVTFDPDVQVLASFK